MICSKSALSDFCFRAPYKYSATTTTATTTTANISGKDEAIDKRITALSTTIFSTFDENNLVNFGPGTKR